MKDEYDFSQSVKNPYTKKQKHQITIRLNEDVISDFKTLATEMDSKQARKLLRGSGKGQNLTKKLLQYRAEDLKNER